MSSKRRWALLAIALFATPCLASAQAENIGGVLVGGIAFIVVLIAAIPVTLVLALGEGIAYARFAGVPTGRSALMTLITNLGAGAAAYGAMAFCCSVAGSTELGFIVTPLTGIAVLAVKLPIVYLLSRRVWDHPLAMRAANWIFVLSVVAWLVLCGMFWALVMGVSDTVSSGVWTMAAATEGAAMPWA